MIFSNHNNPGFIKDMRYIIGERSIDTFTELPLATISSSKEKEVKNVSVDCLVDYTPNASPVGWVRLAPMPKNKIFGLVDHQGKRRRLVSPARIPSN